MNINPDAICGNCGNPYAKHYHESYPGEPELRHYCNTTTSGDIFTDTPSDERLFDLALDEDEGLYKRLLEKWRALNGHKEQA